MGKTIVDTFLHFNRESYFKRKIRHPWRDKSPSPHSRNSFGTKKDSTQ